MKETYKEYPTYYDLKICDGDEILYYEHWIPRAGWIKMSKEKYEKLIGKQEGIYK